MTKPPKVQHSVFGEVPSVLDMLRRSYRRRGWHLDGEPDNSHVRLMDFGIQTIRPLGFLYKPGA